MTYTDEQLEAVQHVVERVAANWDAATTDKVDEELGHALQEAGVELDAEDVYTLASAIETNHGTVTASKVLTASR
ncbi:hypothetical protein [Nocardioides sp. CER19]|uniref:hypothetical protein n=1 Tax=Nocardioides sp. CER19 TaxID=3038538 RepID=UPI0024469DAB|nr:hypothetical protein [Nocardioides sp. CER19]MDH2416475.1 hypothetical protein [Nocardioides sp. CER19]